MTITWNPSTDNVGVMNYILKSTYGHSGRGGGSTTSVDGTPTTNSLTVATTEDKSYNFTVYAEDAAGNISAGSVALFATSAFPPTVNGNLALFAKGPLGILGTGFGILATYDATGLTPYTMAVTGNPSPSLSVIGGPVGMTVDN
jgi:hypothetical protein